MLRKLSRCIFLAVLSLLCSAEQRDRRDDFISPGSFSNAHLESSEDRVREDFVVSSDTVVKGGGFKVAPGQFVVDRALVGDAPATSSQSGAFSSRQEKDKEDECEKEPSDDELAALKKRQKSAKENIHRLLEMYQRLLPMKSELDWQQYYTFNASLYSDYPSLAPGSEYSRLVVRPHSSLPYLGGRPINVSAYMAAVNYSRVSVRLMNITDTFKERKEKKPPMWQCYNGSGIRYGDVRVVNLTSLGLFLHRLPCCNKEHCAPVATPPGNQSAEDMCWESPRQRFLKAVLNVGHSSVGNETEGAGNGSAKKPIPINLNLLWASDHPHSESSSPLQKPRGSNGTRNGSETHERCQCTVLMIFSPVCPFSVKLSPLYSALARQFPTLPFLAVNADTNSSVHYIYGVVGLPTVILLHKHKERYYARAFADWQDLQSMGQFLKKHTGIEPLPNVTVLASDYETGLPTKVERRTDYFLIFSSIYVVVFGWFMMVR